MFHIRYWSAWVSLWFQPLRPLGAYLLDIEEMSYRGTMRAIDERLPGGQLPPPAPPPAKPKSVTTPKPKSVTKAVTKTNRKQEYNGLKCKVCRKGLKGQQRDFCGSACKMKHQRAKERKTANLK